ncbi:DUF29 family protein [Comamonadaceae bacterium SL12-8]|uniref:DUF29 family protein n=1 Tax=Amphibiibacter pelophylacis TaxID=1799477 RepID=A0ACC6P3F9_9BURK
MTIRLQREAIKDHLSDAPSLRPLLSDPQFIRRFWLDALAFVVRETGITSLPESCPWNPNEALSDGWLPPSH